VRQPAEVDTQAATLNQPGTPPHREGRVAGGEALGPEEGARGAGAGRSDGRTRLSRGGGGDSDDSENNTNKSLEARPPHSTPGRPAVTVTCLPSGGKVGLSSSSSSPEPGCRGPSCLPSFPVPPPPPPWEPWTHNREVIKLLQLVRDKGRLCGVELRRAMRKILMEETKKEGRKVKAKANGMDIAEMFDPRMTDSGDTGVIGCHSLQVDAMRRIHAETCDACAWQERVRKWRSDINLIHGVEVHKEVDWSRERCYFDRMGRCVSHGWRPEVTGQLTAQYEAKGNGANATRHYPGAFRAEVKKALAAGFIEPTVAQPGDILHPCNMAVKPSDILRAKVATKIIVTDQQSLDEANVILLEIGQVPIKCRPTTNCTAGGLNGAAYTPSFSNPGVYDALGFIQRGDYLMKGDVAAYYPSFPLAEDARRMFTFKDGGLFVYLTLCFGFAPAAYYCAMWAAEMRRWVTGRGVTDCCHMTDDWLTAGRSESSARANMAVIAATLEEAGFKMAPKKFEIGQQLVFLGVLICTITMTMGFERQQCQGTIDILRDMIGILHRGGSLDKDLCYRIAGKLTWFGSLLLQGRLRTSSWWQATAHAALPPCKKLRSKMVSDAKWWVRALTPWAEGETSHLSFPILSAEELGTKEGGIWIVQSDFAGEGGEHPGGGYTYGVLDDPNPRFSAFRWNCGEEKRHSTFGELVVLQDYLKYTTETRDHLLIWITDSSSAAYMVNAGTCTDSECFDILDDVLEICDSRRIEIIAVWVPRGRNGHADYLSHLASLLNIDRFDGRANDAPRREEASTGGASASSSPKSASRC
jgi:hypothetical protein